MLAWIHQAHGSDGRIPKDMLYGEIAIGSRPEGRPVLCYKDVCKRDLKAGKINPTGWETLAAPVAADRRSWRLVFKRSEHQGGRKEDRRPVGKRGENADGRRRIQSLHRQART